MSGSFLPDKSSSLRTKPESPRSSLDSEGQQQPRAFWLRQPSIVDVSIKSCPFIQAWANCDVTLEEFGFAATTRSGELVRIAVGERDRLRSLSGYPLVQALKSEIERQTRK